MAIYSDTLIYKYFLTVKKHILKHRELGLFFFSNLPIHVTSVVLCYFCIAVLKKQFQELTINYPSRYVGSQGL